MSGSSSSANSLHDSVNNAVSEPLLKAVLSGYGSVMAVSVNPDGKLSQSHEPHHGDDKMVQNVEEAMQQGDSDSEGVNQDAQAGVQNMEAVTSVWTKNAMVLAYVLIWIIYFVDSMQQGATGLLTPYVTSNFEQHSLTPTVNVLSSIIGGVFNLTLAKILDVFGRSQGYIIAVICTTLGLIMMAACNSVETYAAAQVFYWVGYNGLGYTLSIFIADTTSLKNRGLMFAYSSSPFIITTWITGPISQAFLKGPGFRWGFGIFAIITPVVTTPLFFLLWHYNNKAKKLGMIPRRETGRTAWQSFIHYCRQFDAIGLILISFGLALFLLPFNIYSRQPDGWKSPMIIGLLVAGIVLIILFGIWERWFAPVTFIPYELLTDRTVVGANILATSMFISYFIWDSYFVSFLQVVNDLNVTRSGYIAQIYNVGSCFCAVIVGILIRKTGKFKWLALYFGVPVSVLGVGLMIKFRQPDVNLGYVIMCQIFIAFAGGTIVICEQTAVMAATSHQYVAVILAIEAMASYIGGAIGLTIAAAVWQAVFPKKLLEYLPESEKGNFTAIYGSLDVQLSYPVGSPGRIAIQRAYGDGQRMMLIAATAVFGLSLLGVLMWRDLDVKKRKQVKGTVF